MGWFPTAPGGLSRYVFELTHQLVAEGHAVNFCGVGLPDRSCTPGLTLNNLASPRQFLPRRLWTVRQRLSQLPLVGTDAVNLHFALYSLPMLSQLPAGVPITFTFHGPWAMESAREGQVGLNVRLKQWMEQQVYRRCDRFIVLSQAFGTILHQTYGIPWNKIHLIPGGVNTSQFQANLSRQEARTQLGWPLDRPILFTPRRLVHRMGLDQLLTAISQVKRQVPEVWLAIAGKGPLQESLEQQIRERSLENQVRLLGYLPDRQLPIAYQAADLTVVPSQSLEGFGLVLVESLACGTPALCTPVGGMPEVVAPFCPELVTESPEAGAIADRVTQLIQGDLLLPARDACRNYAVHHFNWQRISQAVETVLLA
jgi:glycosyltransferase involved in cell wall biosynthesis